MRRTIAIVDDEPAIQEALKLHLELEGFDVSLASTGTEGLSLAQEYRLDLLVLDISLPEMDGFTLLRRLRADRCLPVIVISGRCETTDRIVGLELGADDYLGKPFDPNELVARIRAVLRRAGNSEIGTHDSRKIRAGDICLDPAAQKADVGGLTFYLNLTECSILELLMRKTGQAVSREKILNHVWGTSDGVEPQVVDVHISHLRKKLFKAGERKRTIQTVRGAGYRFIPA